MNMQGIAISMVYPIMKTLVRKGFEPGRFFEAVGFDTALLKDVEARIEDSELERLMIAAAEYTKDEHFGLHQGQLMDIADMGILGYVMMHSGTVADALSAYRRYNMILCSGYNLDWDVHGSTVAIRLFASSPGTRMSRHCMEDMACSLYCLIGRLSNRRIELQDLTFTHPSPADQAPYSAAFGILPRFGSDANILRMSKDVLDFPILYADPKLLGMFERVAAETKNKLLGGEEFSDRVFHWLMSCMPSHFPTLKQTADSFHMSARTLQNKLKEENTSYNDLSVRVRKELALNYLQKKEYSIGEIAYLLHFSEPSAFHSAFKKWTGVAPGQYRSLHRTSAS